MGKKCDLSDSKHTGLFVPDGLSPPSYRKVWIRFTQTHQNCTAEDHKNVAWSNRDVQIVGS